MNNFTLLIVCLFVVVVLVVVVKLGLCFVVATKTRSMTRK